MPGLSRRSERLMWAGMSTLLAGTTAGMATLFYQLTKRHGEVLLQMEQASDLGATNPSARQMTPRDYLFGRGSPTGSVAMNFELPGLDGNLHTFTSLKRNRTLLIFISPTCEQSLSLLATLNCLPFELDQSDIRIAFISMGSREENQNLASRFHIDLPVLLQDRNEVADLYFVSGTPMAYLVGPNNLTEINRIEGAHAILGVLVSLMTGVDQMPDERMNPIIMSQVVEQMPLRAGDPLPAFKTSTLNGESLSNIDLLGKRSLLVMFDPLCDPCIDLLDDLAKVNADPKRPSVIMITRRDPALTNELIDAEKISYPVGMQDVWEISRLFGPPAVPAACIVDQDGYLESNHVVGRDAIFSLLRQAQSDTPRLKLVSLTSVLQRG